MSSIRHLVALGSSFAAGPGIEPVLDRAAGRSGRNYAHLVAERLDAELTDQTVSGATTETILTATQRIGLRRFSPQLDGVPAAADLVTVTAGGNDLGYLGSLTLTAAAGRFAAHRLTRPLGRTLARRAEPAVTDRTLEQAVAGLVRIVDQVRLRAPHARVLLVDYLTVLGPSSRPDRSVPLDPAAIDVFRRLGDQLAAVFATAADRSGAELVRCSTASVEHAVGSAEPWVHGFRPADGGASFHPNAAGMVAVADEIVRALAA